MNDGIDMPRCRRALDECINVFRAIGTELPKETYEHIETELLLVAHLVDTAGVSKDEAAATMMFAEAYCKLQDCVELAYRAFGKRVPDPLFD